MKRRHFIINSAAGLLGAGLAKDFSLPETLPYFHKSEKETSRPNIFWIMLDDCRYDAVGCYGKSWPATPNIDRLANEGVRFDAAIVQNPVCVPSRKSMKTGY